MIKISIAGVCGRMGSRILALAEADESIELGGIFEAQGHPQGGKEILFREKKIRIDTNCDKAISESDVMIDFTSPAATLEHLRASLKYKKPVVIGTTGFNEEQINEIKSASLKIPIVFSPNMSIGVNLLFKITAEAAKTLKDYDIEIVELHHNQKKDAPSGTAAKLASIISETLGKKIVYGREGLVGARKKEEMGVFAVRAGDIVGEHTVYLAGPGERVELTHRAHSRDCFARGALVAAKWLVKKDPRLYTMQEVLEI